VGSFSDLDLRMRGENFHEEPATPCDVCGRPTKQGHCFYCGHGKPHVRSEEERVAAEERALKLWHESLPIAGTVVEAYLRGRAIAIQLPDPDAVLRWHPRCPFGRGRWLGAMVALLRDVASDHRPCGIHRTPIDLNGKKMGQAMTMGTFSRTAIKLWPAPVNGRLAIGEGIETVMSAVQLDPKLAPAWAVGTAYNVGMFPFIDDLKKLDILADNDSKENGSIGQRKAEQCAGRYSAWAIPAEIHTPKKHKDFNDILRELRRG
jgi:putative DNA primase/helicase